MTNKLLGTFLLYSVCNLNAAVFPFIDRFEQNEAGIQQPEGWRQGPPVGSVSIGNPWSVQAAAGWGNVYQFSGAGEFDGNGRAYSTVEVADVPMDDGDQWEVSVDFQLVDFVTNGPMDSFRFGIGVLGAHFMFSNGRGGGFGGNDYYLIDWGFTLPEEIRQLDRIPMTYRILEWGPLGVIERGFFSGHIAAGFFNTQERFRMIVQGSYSGSSMTLTSWVENLATGDKVDPVAATVDNPMRGRYFGPRFQSGSGVTTVSPPNPNALGELKIYLDNFRVGSVGGEPTPEPAAPLWADFNPLGGGILQGWLGKLIPLGQSRWALHQSFGWLYSTPATQTHGWLFAAEHPELGWLLADAAAFPFVFSDMMGWAYLLEGERPALFIHATESYMELLPQFD